MKASWRLCLAIVLALAPVPATYAESATLTAIQKAYRRSALGAEYKYIEGMLANRSDTFQLFTPQGRMVDLTLERDRFASLLAPAARVHFETKILEFSEAPDGRQVACSVFQDLKTETFQPGSPSARVLSVKTHSRDFWKLETGGWRLVRSQVLSQTLGPGDPLPSKRVDPSLFKKPSK